MDKLIENYRELFRTLNRLHNTNKGLLLKGDIERLERARNILNAQTSNERRIVPSDELGDCNMPHVSGSVRCANCEDVHLKTDRKRKQVLGIGNNTLDTFNCPKCGSGIIYDLLHYR